MRNKLPQSKERGSSLIETLVYVTIVAIVITGFVLAIYSILGAADRSRSMIELADAKLFLEQKIAWALQGAATVSAPAGGSSGGTLTLTKTNFGENPVTIDTAGGGVRMTTSAGAAFITPRAITPVNIGFTHTVSGAHERIRVTGELDGRFATTGIDQTIIIK